VIKREDLRGQSCSKKEETTKVNGGEGKEHLEKVKSRGKLTESTTTVRKELVKLGEKDIEKTKR